MYDGFLDNFVTESAWETDNDSYVILEGTTETLYESLPFRCGFPFSDQNFTLDYVFDGEEVSDETAGQIQGEKTRRTMHPSKTMVKVYRMLN